MKLKIFFILFVLFIYRPEIPGGNCPISENILFECKKVAFYNDIKGKDFSEELLKECIYYEKIEHPDIVLIQAQLETGNYTSEIFWVNNNLFGMKFPRYRKTVVFGEHLNHATYSHWTESVKDYKLWQTWYKNAGYKIDEYLVFLQYIRYATDPHYIPKIITLGKNIS